MVEARASDGRLVPEQSPLGVAGGFLGAAQETMGAAQETIISKLGEEVNVSTWSSKEDRYSEHT